MTVNGLCLLNRNEEKFECIITFNMKDFALAKNIIQVFEPKEY